MDLPDSLAAANVYIFAAMTSSVLIAARVSPQTKGRLAALANAQQLTESAFLKRLVESAFQVMSPPSSEAIAPVQLEIEARGFTSGYGTTSRAPPSIGIRRIPPALICNIPELG
jgi:hypothetical protein